MKKIIAISLLLIFGCSKDDGSSKVEVEIIPGIEIAGNHTLFTYNDGSTDEINIGNIRFDSDFKGEYVLEYIRNMGAFGQTQEYKNKYFDWSFDGVFWNIIDEDDDGFKVRLLPNGLYKLTRVDGYSVGNGLSGGVYFR